MICDETPRIWLEAVTKRVGLALVDARRYALEAHRNEVLQGSADAPTGVWRRLTDWPHIVASSLRSLIYDWNCDCSSIFGSRLYHFLWFVETPPAGWELEQSAYQGNQLSFKLPAFICMQYHDREGFVHF